LALLIYSSFVSKLGLKLVKEQLGEGSFGETLKQQQKDPAQEAIIVTMESVVY